MALTFTLSQGPRDPANTRRATTVTDMYSIVSVTRNSTLQFDFKVGETSGPVQIIRIRNNTLNSGLAVACTLPEFLDTDTPLKFEITPQTIIEVQLRLNDTAMLSKAAQGTRLASDKTSFVVTPISALDPVFIDTTLPPL
jgi:hypothetical protein